MMQVNKSLQVFSLVVLSSSSLAASVPFEISDGAAQLTSSASDLGAEEEEEEEAKEEEEGEWESPVLTLAISVECAHY